MGNEGRSGGPQGSKSTRSSEEPCPFVKFGAGCDGRCQACASAIWVSTATSCPAQGRDRRDGRDGRDGSAVGGWGVGVDGGTVEGVMDSSGAAVAATGCLLYTSDAADDLLCVDLGGRRI